MSHPFTPRQWQTNNKDRFFTECQRTPISVATSRGLSTFDCGNWTIEAYTGTGKTIASGIIVDELFERHPNLLVVVVAPLDEVREGWVRTLDADEEDDTKLAFGWDTETRQKNFNPDDDKVFVTTYQGLVDGLIFTLEQTGRPVVLILDEIHRLEESIKDGETGSAWTKQTLELMGRLTPLYILSLTATPWREGAGACLPKSIIDYYPAELPDGHEDKNRAGLVKPDFQWRYSDELGLQEQSGVTQVAFCPINAKFKELDKKSGSWEDIKTEDLKDFHPITSRSFRVGVRPFVDCGTKNRLDDKPYLKKLLRRGGKRLKTFKRKKKYQGAKGAIFAMDIKSAEQIANFMRREGEDCVLVHSGDKDMVKSNLKSIRDPTGADWVISVGMLGEGVDIPLIKVIVDLSDELTLRSIIQRWGRGVRKIDDYPLLHCVVFYINHPILRFLAKNIKQEIRTARKKPGVEGGPGPGEPKLRKGFAESAPAGVVYDEDSHIEAVRVMADWLLENRDTIVDYVAAIQVAREYVNDGITPKDYDQQKPASSGKKQARQKKAAKTKERTNRVTFIAVQDPGMMAKIKANPDKPMYQIVNGDIKKHCRRFGYTPGTPAYNKCRSERIDSWSNKLGYDK